MSGPPGGFTVETTGELLREGTDRLAAAGSETPRLDAELLLGQAVGAGRTAVVAHPEAPVGADAVRRYRADLERRAADSVARRSMIGAGDRSDKIRTYNFPQDRVTDHRIGKTVHNLPNVMDGDLDDLIDALVMADQADRLGDVDGAA